MPHHTNHDLIEKAKTVFHPMDLCTLQLMLDPFLNISLKVEAGHVKNS
jgi:hypothetical protein